MPEPTVRTMDVTPIFNYTRPVEIVKRFIERVTALEALDREDPDRDNFEPLLDYIRDNIQHVRPAVSEIMADDVRLQIADKKFPIRQPALFFHEFVPYEGDDKVCEECDGLRIAIAHTL